MAPEVRIEEEDHEEGEVLPAGVPFPRDGILSPRAVTLVTLSGEWEPDSDRILLPLDVWRRTRSIRQRVRGDRLLAFALR